jgi:segregation and condensation protein A
MVRGLSAFPYVFLLTADQGNCLKLTRKRLYFSIRYKDRYFRQAGILWRIMGKFAVRFSGMTAQDNFEVKLPLFEGPFDLLLFFIERDELDIYDIPIYRITKDFLDYLHHMEQLNVDVASEFILVAATLMRIKSKMLLPRPQIDEQGNEVDPREELVKHLLEYKKYKSVIDSFHKMEEIELMKEKRGNLMRELKVLAESSNVEAELQDVDLFKLMTVFEKVLKRQEAEKNKPVHQVIQYPYTIEGQREYLLGQVTVNKRVSFVDIVEQYKTRIALIFNFLAILDLLAQGMLAIQVGEGYNNFWITSPETAKEEQPSESAS